MFTRTDGNRSINYEADIAREEDGATVRLSVNVSHHSGGQYVVSVRRAIVSGYFVQTSVFEDSLTRYICGESGTRYSAKRLEEFASKELAKRDTPEVLDMLKNWALQIKTGV